MTTNQLLQNVARLLPDATPAVQFRTAMLLCHAVADPACFEDLEELERQFHQISIRFAGHEDQYAAIASDLDSLANTQPCQFNPQHLWTLIRAIKVQSQLLNFLLGPEPIMSESTAPH